jgi:hypothetical protein
MEDKMTVGAYTEEWDDSQIVEIENALLQGIFGCRTTEAVEAAITYARFVSSVGISPENYPVFLKVLEIENHWVIDALVGDRDPFLLLSPVQPNEFIVGRIFSMMTRWHKGGIYSKNLSVILGVLQSVYSSPNDGYRIYPLSIADVNALGKHLIKESGQDDPLNRAILEILAQLSELQSADNADIEEIAIHASSVRNAFFDNRKQMEEVIPPVLLVAVDDRREIPPRKVREVASDGRIRKAPEEEPAEEQKAKAKSRKVAGKG